MSAYGDNWIYINAKKKRLHEQYLQTLMELRKEGRYKTPGEVFRTARDDSGLDFEAASAAHKTRGERLDKLEKLEKAAEAKRNASPPVASDEGSLWPNPFADAGGAQPGRGGDYADPRWEAYLKQMRAKARMQGTRAAQTREDISTFTHMLRRFKRARRHDQIVNDIATHIGVQHPHIRGAEAPRAPKSIIASVEDLKKKLHASAPEDGHISHESALQSIRHHLEDNDSIRERLEVEHLPNSGIHPDNWMDADLSDHFDDWISNTAHHLSSRE